MTILPFFSNNNPLNENQSARENEKVFIGPPPLSQQQ